MKKALSIIITAVLLLSVFCVPVYAAENDKPEPTSGPWDGFFWMTGGPMIAFGGNGSSEERLVYYRQGMTADSPIVTDNEAVPGATYDKESNTLTLDNVKLPETLSLYYMGDDFKLCVVGECELGYIRVVNYYNCYSTSLNITGIGTLTVNKDRINDEAMYFYGDGDSLMHLDIAPSVTVDMYAAENATEQIPQNVMRIWSTYADPAITVGGKAIPEAKSQHRTETINETVNAAWVSYPDREFNRGKRVTSKTDPEGIYAVKEIQYSEGSGFETRYGVTKYNYYPEFNTYMPDPAYVDQYGDENVILTKEEFEAGYDYVTAPQPKKVRFTSDYREKNRGYRGVKFIKDGDPDSVYIGEKGWSTSYESELGNISTYYLYRARWDEGEQLYVVDEHYPDIARGSEEELKAKGYTIATEKVEKHVSMKCWEKPAPFDDNNHQSSFDVVTRKSDPDGLYVYGGTYTDRPFQDESGVVIYPVFYDEDNDGYYLTGYYGGLVGTDVFHVKDEDWESGNDFAYKTETVEQRAELQFIDKNYKYDNYSTEAILLNKDGATCAAELLDWGNGRNEYVVYQVEWREDKGRYYATDSGEWDHRYENFEALEAAGYQMVFEDQHVDYTITSRVNTSGMDLYKDGEGNSYFKDYNGDPYSISESNKFTYGDKEYYIGTAAEDVNPADLQLISREKTRDDQMWWIEGTEYHHKGEAVEPQAYELWVNNEQFTDDHLVIQCGDGTATFDPATYTLTLNNAQITKGAEKDWLYTGILDFLDEELTIVVNGDCTITETGGDGIGSYQFDENWQMVPHDMTVKGDGKLTIKESTRMYGYGFYCTGALTLDGVDIDIESAATGVWAKDLSIKDSSINSDCSTGYSGIVVNNGDFRFENSTVNATSAQGAGLLLGNNVDPANLELVSGTLTLRGRVGIDCEENVSSTVTISGGRFDVAGTDTLFEYLPEDRFTLGENVVVTSGGFDQNNIVIEETVKPQIIIGDANGDKIVDVLDAAIIQKYAAGKSTLTPDQFYAADVNGDNNADVLDAALIQKYAAGKITEFPKKA